MIVLVTGPPGAGKSYYAVRKVAQALDAGKPVATNVRLTDDWTERMDRRSVTRRLKPFARRRFRDVAPRSYYFSEDLDALMRVRLKGKGESRGVMVWDEAHNWMNARSWTAQDRQQIVRWASQHRKMGWDLFVIAQQAEMIDKQVRGLFEYHVQLRNLKRARFCGVPLSPVNMFLAVWCWHSAQRVVLKREVFPLTWQRRLYDTFQLSHGQQEDEETGAAIWLPRPHLDSAPADETLAPPDSRTDARGTSAAGRVPAGTTAATPAALAGWDVEADDEAHDAETGDPTQGHA